MSFPSSGELLLPPNAAVRTLADPTSKGMPCFHQIASGSLFPSRPSRGDINQGAIGNCYALAAANAIVTRAEGPEHIVNAMTDEGNGYVALRLWDGGTWKYFRVRKSVRTRLGPAQRSKGALWVNILEKAIMVLDSKGDYALETGGTPGPVLTRLLGPGHTGFKMTEQSDAERMLANLIMYCYVGTPIQGQKWHRLAAQVAEAVFGGQPDGALFAAWMGSHTSTKANKWSVSASRRTLALLNSVLHGAPDAAAKAVLAYAVGMSAIEVPGKYSQSQLDIYAAIGRAVSSQVAVAAATTLLKTGTKSFAERFKGGTVGEDRKGGLIAKHAYTVVGIGAKHNDYLGVVLRNPHGKTGRKYRVDGQANITGSVATSAAEFWLELNEFCTDFSVTYGGQVQSPGRANLMAEIQGQRR